jgi:hypothetical protein
LRSIAVWRYGIDYAPRVVLQRYMQNHVRVFYPSLSQNADLGRMQ